MKFTQLAIKTYKKDVLAGEKELNFNAHAVSFADEILAMSSDLRENSVNLHKLVRTRIYQNYLHLSDNKNMVICFFKSNSNKAENFVASFCPASGHFQVSDSYKGSDAETMIHLAIQPKTKANHDFFKNVIVSGIFPSIDRWEIAGDKKITDFSKYVR